MSSQKFLVLVDKSATQEQMDQTAADIESKGGRILDSWTSALKGFSVVIDTADLTRFQSLQGTNNFISTIEPDGEVHVN
ncbi:hypothetical protein DACRYDRAFT_20809 [Dacryopinax primogenitus]|uniref:Inhibitor I9 domain-containing protein n=1 Tax=Dacryopinax primogenitus (strain DJM 731) TaxID=1858805 RepID=M5GD27_DACPD|nr:uncharacterized protein DACRYDRAFT_20809 [Dacryopinax primogenitus]EJU04197.1 hypothetical protein DACRYDRAFT_20809 [Dacryopinax primogenitus]